MKTLIYSFALLTSLLLISSCQNDGVLPQINNSGIPDTSKKGPVVNAGCDTTKLINLVLYNGTTAGSFEIALSGPANYTFIFPVQGYTTVAVKPGKYGVQLYSPGTYMDYGFYLTGREIVQGSGAVFASVLLASCAGPQFASIVPSVRNDP